jgi:hypothetical protein
MKHLLCGGLLGLLLPLSLLGQGYYPAAGDSLTFRHIAFQWPLQLEKPMQYELEIHEGSPQGPEVFRGSTAYHSLLVKDGLDFGRQYWWRITQDDRQKTKDSADWHHFFIRITSRVDTQYWRHEVVVNDPEWKDDYLFCIDKPGVIIDRLGKPVWFHPDTTIARFFDLRILPNGHIAYLRPRGGGEGNENLVFEEVSLRGELIWRAPDLGAFSADTNDRYHHEYQILANGNYLLAGDEYVDLHPPNAKGPINCRMGVVLEYNPEGELVWVWKAQDHLSLPDIFARGLQANPVHLNGFYLDEQTDELYVSFRYLDRVLKVDHQTGAVLDSYGSREADNLAGKPNSLFHRQHSPHVWGNHLFLYDNGTGKKADTLSAALILDLETEDQPQVRWRFPLNFGHRRNSWSESKGDIDRLKDRLVLVDMGSLPRTLVIDTTRGILWHCEHRFRPAYPGANWQPVPANYRADASLSLWPQAYGLGLQTPAEGSKAIYLSIKNMSSEPQQYQVQIRRRTRKTPQLAPGAFTKLKVRARDLKRFSVQVLP